MSSSSGSPSSSLHIIIAGGSITGLTLALMLEHFNISYILLEAHPEIAPQVGASIGLSPAGSRILDQLGIFNEIYAIVGDALPLTRQRILELMPKERCGLNTIRPVPVPGEERRAIKIIWSESWPAG